MKIAVIIATYCRKQGTSKKHLETMFNYLENQTYKDFKVFIVGDNYSNNVEFDALCKSYKGDIYYYNSPVDYRTNTFKHNRNKWTCGGSFSRRIAIKKAIEEDFDYYFHIDDDDVWKLNHIETYVANLKKFPETAFMICKSKFNKGILPRSHKSITKNGYNNYMVKSCDSVHASWCINLHILGKLLMELYDERISTIDKIKRNLIKETAIYPMDANILKNISNQQKNKKIKCMCLVSNTCVKLNDCNIPK
jgi:hypothetical protein